MGKAHCVSWVLVSSQIQNHCYRLISEHMTGLMLTYAKNILQPVLSVYWVQLMYFGSHLNFFQLLGITIIVRSGKWQPIPVFLPGEPQGRESLVGYCLWGRTELDTTKRLSSSSKIWDYLCVCIWTSQVVQVLKNTYQCRRQKEADSVSGLQRASGGGHGNSLKYSCMENRMDRGTWQL